MNEEVCLIWEYQRTLQFIQAKKYCINKDGYRSSLFHKYRNTNSLIRHHKDTRRFKEIKFSPSQHSEDYKKEAEDVQHWNLVLQIFSFFGNI